MNLESLRTLLDPRKRSPDFQRGLRNAAYNTGAHVLIPILWLVCTPVFVAGLGVEQYGIWMLVNTLLGLGGVVSFGISDATVKFVAQRRAQGNDAGIAEVIRFSFSMYTLLGLVAAGLLYVAAPWVAQQTHSSGQTSPLAVTAIRVGCLGLLLNLINGVVQAALHGYERYDLDAKVSVAVNVLTFGVQTLLVVSGYQLVEVLVATVLLLIPSIAGKIWIIKRQLLPILTLRPLFKPSVIREMFAYGFYSWLQGLGGMLLSQIDRLLVASMLGTSVLAYYAICLSGAQQIHVLLSRAVAFVFPLASAVIETGDLDRLRRIYFKASRFTTVAAVALGLPLFVFAHEFLAIWIDEHFATQSAHLLRLLILAFVGLATTIVPYYYLNGTGLVRLNTVFGLVSGAVVSLAALVFIPLFGAAGAALARLTNVPVALISRAVLHYRVLLDKQWFSGLLVVLPVALPFGLGFIAKHLLGVLQWNLVELVVAAACCSLVGAALAWVISSFADRRWSIVRHGPRFAG